jgi:hypothetical protein
MKPLERAAQALFDRDCERAVARGHEPHHKPGTDVRTMPPSYKDDYMADAAAMLKAIRQPSDFMICAALDAFDRGNRGYVPEWQAMIDAALKECGETK